MSNADRIALAAVLALLVVFGLFRLDPSDIPEHLMVGRLIWERGAPMTTNELSWTFPDHPVHQQYPLYNVGIWLLLDNLGWESLSVFCSLTWTLAVLAWMEWSGGLKRCAGVPDVWVFVVVGVQRHIVARPEVFTILGMGLILVAWSRWRRDPTLRGPLVAMVATQWLMVNTHQMWILGLALQVTFLVHLLLTRAVAGRGWFDDRDAALPLAPIAATLVASLLVLQLSPYGPRVYLAPVALLATMGQFGLASDRGAQSDELAPVWHDPIAAIVVMFLSLVLALAAWKTRRRWLLYEFVVVGLGLALVLMALRGIPFYALAAGAVATRWGARATPLLPIGSPVHPTRKVGATLLSLVLLATQLEPREHAFLLRQQGLGKSIGEWGEHTTKFLREHPPPGEMLNIGWFAANYLNFDVYPVKRVFVDGRWEAYPIDFLDDCLRMPDDPAVLRRMIDEWDPGFVLAEMRQARQQRRLAELVLAGEARLVYVDTIAAIAVRPKPGAEAYLAEFGMDAADIDPPDWLPEHPVLYAQQQVRVAILLKMLGEDERAGDLLREAGASSWHPEVRDDLSRVPE